VAFSIEYAATKEECSLESKSCIESVAAPTPHLFYIRLYTLIQNEKVTHVDINSGINREIE